MNSYLRKAAPIYVFLLSAVGLLLISSSYDIAQAQLPPCNIEICKSAPQLPVPQSEEEAVIFPFTSIRGQSVNEFSLAANGRCTGGSLFIGQIDEITEDPLEGWQLDNVDCEGDPGIVVTFIENGFSALCQSEGFISCTFTNRRVPAIPTLSEWGMIAAAAGLALIGVFFAVRRRKALNF